MLRCVPPTILSFSYLVVGLISPFVVLPNGSLPPHPQVLFAIAALEPLPDMIACLFRTFEVYTFALASPALDRHHGA